MAGPLFHARGAGAHSMPAARAGQALMSRAVVVISSAVLNTWLFME